MTIGDVSNLFRSEAWYTHTGLSAATFAGVIWSSAEKRCPAYVPEYVSQLPGSEPALRILSYGACACAAIAAAASRATALMGRLAASRDRTPGLRFRLQSTCPCNSASATCPNHDATLSAPLSRKSRRVRWRRAPGSKTGLR